MPIAASTPPMTPIAMPTSAPVLSSALWLDFGDAETDADDDGSFEVGLADELVEDDVDVGLQVVAGWRLSTCLTWKSPLQSQVDYFDASWASKWQFWMFVWLS